MQLTGNSFCEGVYMVHLYRSAPFYDQSDMDPWSLGAHLSGPCQLLNLPQLTTYFPYREGLSGAPRAKGLREYPCKLYPVPPRRILAWHGPMMVHAMFI
jgi:hypothetical protein